MEVLNYEDSSRKQLFRRHKGIKIRPCSTSTDAQALMHITITVSDTAMSLVLRDKTKFPTKLITLLVQGLNLMYSVWLLFQIIKRDFPFIDFIN